MTITFFGHNNTSEDIQPLLQKVLIDLIENQKATLFYVGNHGNFDSMVKKSLKVLQDDYQQIKYAIVLAYLPQKQYEHDDYLDTIYPENIENTPLRFAICKRNEWMINQADIIITYVKHPFGGAAKFKELAEKKGKTVINLADLEVC